MPSDLRSALRAIPLFAGLPAEDLRRVGELARTRWYAKGREVVFKASQAGQLYAILRGRLKVTGPNLDGGEITFAILGPGEVFGEIALLDGQARSATVTTLEACELLLLEREPFVALLHAHPAIGVRLLEVMARRVRLLSERVEDSAFLDLPARLAKQLLRLAERYGERLPDGGVRVGLSLSQGDLGELCGATRESVNKQLQAWRRRKLVGPAGAELVLRDPAALRALTAIRD
jgi:CRP-like cAMP-binding protein